MNNQPTLETDALVPQFLNGGEVPDIFAHCRKLERERDELKEQLGQAMEIAEDFCGLVCYGMGTRPEDWSIENTRDARRTINWFQRLQEAVKK